MKFIQFVGGIITIFWPYLSLRRLIIIWTTWQIWAKLQDFYLSKLRIILFLHCFKNHVNLIFLSKNIIKIVKHLCCSFITERKTQKTMKLIFYSWLRFINIFLVFYVNKKLALDHMLIKFVFFNYIS